MGQDDVEVTVYTPEEAPLASSARRRPPDSAPTSRRRASRRDRRRRRGGPRRTGPPGRRRRRATARRPARDRAAARRGARRRRPDSRRTRLHPHRRARSRGVGAGDVWAAGDAIAFPIKQGGLAAQQADAAAEAIAAEAGADIAPQPFRPVLRGVLLTGRGRRWIRRDLDGGPRRARRSGTRCGGRRPRSPAATWPRTSRRSTRRSSPTPTARPASSWSSRSRGTDDERADRRPARRRRAPADATPTGVRRTTSRVGQIYLLDNPLLREPLRLEHVKPRLLGHWGTTPGLNFLYAHMNRAIKARDLEAIYITGPGHGGPGARGQHLPRGHLQRRLPPHRPRRGRACASCSASSPSPAGSRVTSRPETPGSIHEGGELGYALVHAYGAVFDNPGSARAAASSATARRRPGRSRRAGTRTSSSTRRPTAPCCRSCTSTATRSPTRRCSPASRDDELRALLEGYGYAPRFVEGSTPTRCTS